MITSYECFVFFLTAQYKISSSKLDAFFPLFSFLLFLLYKSIYFFNHLNIHMLPYKLSIPMIYIIRSISSFSKLHFHFLYTTSNSFLLSFLFKFFHLESIFFAIVHLLSLLFHSHIVFSLPSAICTYYLFF